MHLKSTNGPVDVLVCPEGDDQRAHSPCPSMDNETMTSTPVKTVSNSNNPSSSQDEVMMQVHQEDLDVSLSSAADAATEDDIDEFIQTYNCEDLERQLDTEALLPANMYSFESLSPPLQVHDDFCFGLDGAEGIAELFDLV